MCHFSSDVVAGAAVVVQLNVCSILFVFDFLHILPEWTQDYTLKLSFQELSTTPPSSTQPAAAASVAHEKATNKVVSYSAFSRYEMPCMVLSL